MKKLYFIGIEVPSPLKEEIISLKQTFIEKYGVEHALKSPPHITLQMPMRIIDDREKELISELQSLTATISSGRFQLSGISSFPPRTIFIDVQMNPWLEDVRNLVQASMATAGFGKSEDRFHPHITLMTRDLNEETYSIAFDELKALEYSSECSADSVTLFKHNGKHWEALEVFRLA